MSMFLGFFVIKALQTLRNFYIFSKKCRIEATEHFIGTDLTRPKGPTLIAKTNKNDIQYKNL